MTLPAQTHLLQAARHHHYFVHFWDCPVKRIPSHQDC